MRADKAAEAGIAGGGPTTSSPRVVITDVTKITRPPPPGGQKDWRGFRTRRSIVTGFSHARYKAAEHPVSAVGRRWYLQHGMTPPLREPRKLKHFYSTWFVLRDIGEVVMLTSQKIEEKMLSDDLFLDRLGKPPLVDISGVCAGIQSRLPE
jgi:hypothetical protein